jgi:hypothetical protein
MHMKMLDEETILVGHYPVNVSDYQRIENTSTISGHSRTAAEGSTAFSAFSEVVTRGAATIVILFFVN